MQLVKGSNVREKRDVAVLDKMLLVERLSCDGWLSSFSQC